LSGDSDPRHVSLNPTPGPLDSGGRFVVKSPEGGNHQSSFTSLEPDYSRLFPTRVDELVAQVVREIGEV
jgi:hypothetical protein